MVNPWLIDRFLEPTVVDEEVEKNLSYGCGDA